MVSSFLQLRSESTLAMAEALMEGDLGDFMDDDDVYFAPAGEGPDRPPPPPPPPPSPSPRTRPHIIDQ